MCPIKANSTRDFWLKARVSDGNINVGNIDLNAWLPKQPRIFSRFNLQVRSLILSSIESKRFCIA
jgi:hypothetical protein